MRIIVSLVVRVDGNLWRSSCYLGRTKLLQSLCGIQQWCSCCIFSVLQVQTKIMYCNDNPEYNQTLRVGLQVRGRVIYSVFYSGKDPFTPSYPLGDIRSLLSYLFRENLLFILVKYFVLTVKYDQRQYQSDTFTASLNLEPLKYQEEA